MCRKLPCIEFVGSLRHFGLDLIQNRRSLSSKTAFEMQFSKVILEPIRKYTVLIPV
jgi:hypothetical protein